VYDYKEKKFKLTAYGSREGIRRQVVLEFLEEIPGKGTEDKASRYKYHVETLRDGVEIILTRPTSQGWQKLRGFDFRIDVPKMNFSKRGRKRVSPKHADIENDLKMKGLTHPRLASKLLEAIERVYECEDVEQVLKDFDDLEFGVGFSVEFLLKVINWHFIEQDMRDWNYSGRDMFYSGIRKALG
jgi:hypothetical protein